MELTTFINTDIFKGIVVVGWILAVRQLYRGTEADAVEWDDEDDYGGGCS